MTHNLKDIYIPQQASYWLEWRSTLIKFAAVVGLLFAWCVVGEWLL